MSKISTINITSFSADIVFDNGISTKTFSGVLKYRKDATPIVSSISPKIGDVYGGYNITITGVNLNSTAPSVNIDGIDCAVQTATSTSIICLVGQRLKLPNKVTFDVKVGGRPAILKT